MIAIVDYGMGNLRSVQKAFESLGAEAVVTSTADGFAKARALVVPGQGSFPDAMKSLGGLGLVEPIRRWIDDGKPFLGVCLGIQLLFSESEEGDSIEGLKVLAGHVKKLPPGQKIPHMGWNSIRKTPTGARCPILDGIPDDAFFYFVHSYYPEPADADLSAATTDYGMPFTSVVWRDNVFATQFHPEKSQEHGLRLLRNFVAML